MKETTPLSAPRRLLRRLRDMMASHGSAQTRLNQVVSLIATDMVAEVCSCYLLRAGDVMELFATKGLNPDAVHKTRMALNEGLVGHIATTARPLNLADAQSHPSFAYRPETGEEIYSSLMGVPILRDDRVIGVLVVQNRVPRRYGDEEREVLQVVAMVVAELVAGGELVDPAEWLAPEGSASGADIIEGQPLAGGLAWGRVAIVRSRPSIARLVADDPATERKRLTNAVSELRTGLDRLVEQSGSAGAEPRDVLETFRMFAADSGWVQRIAEAIDSGLSAEAAVVRVQEQTRLRMSQAANPYLRERLNDINELGDRLIDHLVGRDAPVSDEGQSDLVIVARTLGAAQLLEYDRKRLRAVVLEEGSPTAHVAIIARSLEIPMVGQVREAPRRLSSGELIAVDGGTGRVTVRPEESEIAALRRRTAERARQRSLYRAFRDQPARTRDGIDVGLYINVDLLMDAARLDSLGAAGIGLCRTELLFMTAPKFPGIEEQAALYRSVLVQAGERPVVFRTLDIRSDKRLPEVSVAARKSPSRNGRIARVKMNRPAMLRRQIQALLRAAAGGELRIMFPMVATVDEFVRARTLLEREQERARKRGEPRPEKLVVGSMIEVPALMWQLPALLEKVEFLSLGSNDLIQFLFASDRGNSTTSYRYGLLSPPALSLIRDLVDKCDKARVPLSVCGEAAGSALEAMTLIGAGVRKLSMSPGRIGPIKAMCRSLDTRHLRTMLDDLCESSVGDVHARLHAFALDHKVVLQ